MGEFLLVIFVVLVGLGVIGGIRMGMFWKAYEGRRVEYQPFYLPVPPEVARQPEFQKQVSSIYGRIGKALNARSVSKLTLAARNLRMEGLVAESRKLILVQRGRARVYVYATAHGSDVFASMAPYFAGPISWWKWLLIGMYILAWFWLALMGGKKEEDAPGAGVSFTVSDLMRGMWNEFEFDDLTALTLCVQDAVAATLDEIGRGLNVDEKVLERVMEAASRPLLTRGKYVRA